MRLIDADVLKEKLTGIQTILNLLDEATVVYSPRWLPIETDNNGRVLQCSMCGMKLSGIDGTPYCPRCGSKMAAPETEGV